MALRAMDVASLDAPTRVAQRPATITHLAPSPRPAAGVARRERTRWLAVGIALTAAPFLGCIAVLEVVR
jgi:hypothetical protein